MVAVPTPKEKRAGGESVREKKSGKGVYQGADGISEKGMVS